jgi:hypothetical protein
MQKTAAATALAVLILGSVAATQASAAPVIPLPKSVVATFDGNVVDAAWTRCWRDRWGRRVCQRCWRGRWGRVICR